jgi:hypothetical protein
MQSLPTVNTVQTVAPSVPTQQQQTAEEARRQKELEEIIRLQSQCEDYLDNADHWRFLLKSYEGGPKYIGTDTLHKHRREHASDYQARLDRAHYQNYCQPLVDFVPEYIFSQGVEREAPGALKNAFEQFLANCDRSGTSLNAFMQAVGEDARIFGMTYVHVDKLPLPENLAPEEVSVQRATEIGLDLPYLINVRPLEVYDWTTDTCGNFLYLKRCQTFSRFDGQSTRLIERYTEWTPSQFVVSEIDVTDPRDPRIISKRPSNHPWKVVPFIPAYFKRLKSNKDIGQSFLQDIAYQNNHAFNLTSLVGEFLYRQCFNILVLPGRSIVPTKDQVEGDIGTGSVLEVPDDAKVKPDYLSPPVDPAEFLQSEREKTVAEMYRQAAQDIMSDLFKGKNAGSGDAQKQSFSRTIPVINKTADMLEQVEKNVMVLWAKMQGKEWEDGKVSYKDDYSITNLLDLLLQLSQIFNSVKLTTPTFVREEWKRVIREFDSKIPHQTVEKIFAEIDKLTDQDIKDLFKTPADIKAEMGVPSTSNLQQGKSQKQLGTDKRIGAASGSKAATKESAPDANRRAKGGRSNK